MSLRLRFTLLSAALTTLVVGLVGLGLYVAFDRQQHDRVDARLLNLVAQTQRDPGRRLVGGEPPRQVLRPESANAFFGYALDPGGAVVIPPPVAGLASIRPPADALARAQGGQTALATVSFGGDHYRLAVAPAPAWAVGARLLVVGQSLQYVDDATAPLRWMLGVATATSLLLGAGLGWLVARRALRPVTRLSEAAESIGSGADLSRRLTAPRGNDEVAHLSHAFNASLDRIEATYRELEELLDRQRRFVADASHELRTPLTSIRADIGMLERYPEMDGDERTALVRRCAGEVERISRLAADLLDQARADSAAVSVAAVRWDEVVAEAVSELRRIAAPRTVTAHVDALPSGVTDSEAVLRIVRVAGENLARHTPPETAVTAWVERAGDRMVMVVEDDGPGVGAALLEVIFHRFVRGDPSRSGPGSGLGLAIAQGLATALGGGIEAETVDPHGLRLRLSLPLDSPAAGPGGAASGGEPDGRGAPDGDGEPGGDLLGTDRPTQQVAL